MKKKKKGSLKVTLFWCRRNELVLPFPEGPTALTSFCTYCPWVGAITAETGEDARTGRGKETPWCCLSTYGDTQGEGAIVIVLATDGASPAPIVLFSIGAMPQPSIKT